MFTNPVRKGSSALRWRITSRGLDAQVRPLLVSSHALRSHSALTSAAASEFGPFAPQNPYTAANGAATMHGDSESSGASPYPGPGTGTQLVVPNELAAACPTVLQGSDGMPVALCTSILGRNPVVYLLDPSTGSTLASLNLPAGNLFAGVYAYMDQENRVVLFDANGNLLRIGHHYSGGSWTLSIDSTIPAAAAIEAHCASLCGGVVGIAPDWSGRVWFVTADGVAGYVEPQTGAVKTIVLGTGEQVANSISTAPQGTAIATDHALYFLIARKRARRSSGVTPMNGAQPASPASSATVRARRRPSSAPRTGPAT